MQRNKSVDSTAADLCSFFNGTEVKNAELPASGENKGHQLVKIKKITKNKDGSKDNGQSGA